MTFIYFCLNSMFAKEILRIPISEFNSSTLPEAFAFTSDGGNVQLIRELEPVIHLKQIPFVLNTL